MTSTTSSGPTTAPVTDPTTAPVTDSGAPRRALELPGILNLRDIGGYPAADGRRVRWRTLLRSGAMPTLDGRGRAVFAQIGLRTVVDLREDAEVRGEPDALGRLPITVRRVPIYTAGATAAGTAPVSAAGTAPVNIERAVDDSARPGSGAAATAGALAGVDAVRRAGESGDLDGVYRHMLDDRGERLTAAVLALAAPRALPGLVHCSAGKDRTGLVVALVLDLLGVPTDVIVTDFALTSLYLRDEATAAIRRMSSEALGGGREIPAALMACPPELIERSLERIRARHGGARGYLLAHGAPAAALDRLADALLTDRHS